MRGPGGILTLGPLNSFFWWESTTEQRGNNPSPSNSCTNPIMLRRAYPGERGVQLHWYGMIWKTEKFPSPIFLHPPQPPHPLIGAVLVIASSSPLALFEMSRSPERQPWDMWPVREIDVADSFTLSVAAAWGTEDAPEVKGHFDPLLIHCHSGNKYQESFWSCSTVLVLGYGSLGWLRTYGPSLNDITSPLGEKQTNCRTG